MMDIVNVRLQVEQGLRNDGVVILPPMDVMESIDLLNRLGIKPTTTMLDPWYNRGTGGEREDYVQYITGILNELKDITDHLYLWGFPDIVARFIERIPEPLMFKDWITWYAKNVPSRKKGWRPSQQTCLHLSIPSAKLHPKNFLNEEQQEKLRMGKLQFFPGPTSVIEEAMIIGFVGKDEQTGHPSQKPEKVYNKLFMMSNEAGDLVFDPMAGGGTTGTSCLKLGIQSIICDMSEEYTRMCEKRLGVSRIELTEAKVICMNGKKKETVLATTI